MKCKVSRGIKNCFFALDLIRTGIKKILITAHLVSNVDQAHLLFWENLRATSFDKL